jgi:hypothetical protein
MSNRLDFNCADKTDLGTNYHNVWFRGSNFATDKLVVHDLWQNTSAVRLE